MKISVITRDNFNDFAAETRFRGKDLAEVLDRAGVLLTPERKKAIEANVLDEVAELLATTSAHQWTRKNTQMDLIHALSSALRALATERRK